MRLWVGMSFKVGPVRVGLAKSFGGRRQNENEIRRSGSGLGSALLVIAAIALLLWLNK